jgi:Dolichyl-phosphate-mannose-protein mannosyltransferase
MDSAGSGSRASARAPSSPAIVPRSVLPVTDQSIHSTLTALAMLALTSGGVAVLVGRLRRSMPGFDIGPAALAALAMRVLAAALISLTSIAPSLRGGDEITFLHRAARVVATPLGSSEWANALGTELHVFVLAVQHYLFDSPELALRVTQAGIAVIGLVLLAAAVYELAGPRASVIAMWLLAFEPAGIFFSSLLHKEANMMLAIGLVGFGGARIWQRGRPRYLLPIVAGCLVAVATRHYAGWFLIAAGAATVLHAGLRAEHRESLRSLAMVALVVLFGAIAAPTVLNASTNESLEKNLQTSQEANAAGGANLKLEKVDFSTRGAIVQNLPFRSADVLLRPFPWQLGNISQGLGLLGTAAAYLALFFLAREMIRNRGRIMTRAGPLIYVALFMLAAYALSAGNAGTAFRYRTALVALFICILVALRKPVPRAGAVERPVEGVRQWRRPAPTGA